MTDKNGEILETFNIFNMYWNYQFLLNMLMWKTVCLVIIIQYTHVHVS